jgi:hypothetical protein
MSRTANGTKTKTTKDGGYLTSAVNSHIPIPKKIAL